MLLQNLIKLQAVGKSALETCTRFNSFRASMGKINRPVYGRMYPVKLVKEDGSSINIMYHEPIAIIKAPFNIDNLDETERKRRLLKRQMAGKTDTKKKSSGILVDKAIKFDPKKYLKQKKKN